MAEKKKKQYEPSWELDELLQIENNMVKFEIYGLEMIEKEIKKSGNSGRVYLPPSWIGHKVKIVRT